jgi:N-acetylglucosamine kinase-like BadF-type ATPase
VFGGTGFVHDAGRVDGIVSALEPALSRLLPLPTVDVVAVGHTGLPVDEAERLTIARLLSDRTGASQVLLTPDWTTAHLGALGGGPGVVISAGTGAVALGVDSSGRTARVDGFGYLFGDAGSAFAIGRRALELALRDLDGRLSAPGLAAAARARFGPDLHAAAWGLYASPTLVDVVARFAPDVIELAHAGDAPAGEIIQRAAEDLASSAAAAAAPFDGGPVDVAVTGRLLGGATGNELARRFAPALAAALPHSTLRVSQGGSLEGAVALAERGPGIHSSLVHSYSELS